MARWVVLRHAMPDGSFHFDWMLEVDATGPLRTFRIADPNWKGLLDSVEFAAERLPDHRREYLDYEGEVSAGRGRVMRVDAGEWTPLDPSDARTWGLRLALGRGGSRTALGTEGRDGAWTFHLHP